MRERFIKRVASKTLAESRQEETMDVTEDMENMEIENQESSSIKEIKKEKNTY